MYTVSVRLMTFNHEPFIKEAMEGIMMQKTNFNVEVVVGDDFSADDTLKIIKKFDDYENIHIRILDRKVGDDYWEKRKKYGRLYNFYNILENCTGKYIALLDGDDYWTDPLKLQKQVDFLEKNDKYGLVHGDCDFLYEDGRIERAKNKSLNLNYGYKNDPDILFKQIINSDYKIRTATVLFKRSYFLEIKDTLKLTTDKFLMGDTPLWLLLSHRTKFYYMNDALTVYRISPYSSSRPKDFKKRLRWKLSMSEARIWFLKYFNSSIPSHISHLYNFRLLKYKNFDYDYTEMFPLSSPTLLQKLKKKAIQIKFIRILLRYSYKDYIKFKIKESTSSFYNKK